MKILISAPIGGTKQYSINDWFTWIAEQTFPKENIDICICVNGSGALNLTKKLDEVSIDYPDGTVKKIITLTLPDSNDLTVIQKITYSREMIRRFAVLEDYDYIFFLDTDTIPAHRDALEVLINNKKDCVSGLYFYKNTAQPVIIDKDTHTNISIDKCREAADKKEVIEVWGFGFGCLLLSRKAFLTNAFDYGLFGEERTDDFGYCHVLEQKGITRYFNPYIICKHLTDPNVSCSDIGTKLPFMVKDGKNKS